MKVRTIQPFDVRRGEIKFPRDQMREAIRILHCEAQGRPISGYFDSAAVSHELGFGDFDPLGVIDAVTDVSIYDGAWEAGGFRIPTANDAFRHLRIAPQAGVGQAHFRAN
jgi:hypothetical protein